MKRVGFRSVTLLLVLASSASGQTKFTMQSARPQLPRRIGARPLRVDKVVKLNAPAFGIWGHAVCDVDGNLYFRTGATASEPHVVRLTPSKDDNQIFELKGEYAKSNDLSNFTVSNDGRLWMAVTTGASAAIDEFDTSGDMISEIKLDAPDDYIPQDLAVFDSGAMFVSGYFGSAAAEERRGKSFSAIFQSSGKLYKPLDTGMSEFSAADLKKHPWEGGASIGSDGNVYVLRQNSVLVFSQSGELVRKVLFDKQDPNSYATRVDVSNGYISVELDRVPEIGGGEIKPQFLVLDASTGDVVGLYEPEEGLGNAMFCFSRQEGYTFLAIPESGGVSAHISLAIAHLK